MGLCSFLHHSLTYVQLFKINFYWSIVDLQCVCVFLLYSRVNQYKYTYPFFFRFFSSLVYYRVLGRVPWAIQSVILYFICSSVYMLISVSQFIPPPTYPLSNHEFIFYICHSISIL